MPSITIPEEGYKLVVIAGYFNQKPIWRDIGRVSVGKNGKLAISIDKVFSPAGVPAEPDSATVMLAAVPFSKEQMERKSSYNKPATTRNYNVNPSPDLEDDIPF